MLNRPKGESGAREHSNSVGITGMVEKGGKTVHSHTHFLFMTRIHHIEGVTYNLHPFITTKYAILISKKRYLLVLLLDSLKCM